MTKPKSGPLKGIKVLDLSLMFPGPLASMYLGDMGAEVIKVEHPQVGDFVRHMGAQVPAQNTKDKTSGIYLMVNRNKRSLTLNIKKKKGRVLLLELLAKTDIFIEGFPAGTLEKLGLDYASIKELFPKLLYCHISAYGYTGPYKRFSGHDANFLAVSGALDLIGPQDSAPILPCFQIGSLGGGSLILLSSILAALYARTQSGQGQFIDISMLDGTFSFLPTILGSYEASKQLPERSNSTLSGAIGNYAIYECKDHKYLVLAALEPQFLQAFFKTIGKEELNKYSSKDYRKLTELKPILQQIFMQQPRAHWLAIFKDINACLSPVNNLSEALQNEQLQARDMIISINHPDYGDLTMIGSPFKFSQTPCSYTRYPPNLGEHTNEILAQELGLNKKVLAQLKEERII
jgi:crotonobetainyl-CoA:carnitine CoA-transferase CaiB-like acyl-CoA transferase